MVAAGRAGERFASVGAMVTFHSAISWFLVLDVGSVGARGSKANINIKSGGLARPTFPNRFGKVENRFAQGTGFAVRHTRGWGSSGRR